MSDQPTRLDPDERRNEQLRRQRFATAQVAVLDQYQTILDANEAIHCAMRDLTAHQRREVVVRAQLEPAVLQPDEKPGEVTPQELATRAATEIARLRAVIADNSTAGRASWVNDAPNKEGTP